MGNPANEENMQILNKNKTKTFWGWAIAEK